MKYLKYLLYVSSIAIPVILGVGAVNLASGKGALGATPSNSGLPGIYNATGTNLVLRDGYGSALATDQNGRVILSPSSTVSGGGSQTLAQTTALGASTSDLTTFSGGLNVSDGFLGEVTGSFNYGVETPMSSGSTYKMITTIANANFDYINNAGVAGALPTPTYFWFSDSTNKTEWTRMGMASTGTYRFDIIGSDADAFDGSATDGIGVSVALGAGKSGSSNGTPGNISLTSADCQYAGCDGGNIITDLGAGTGSGVEGFFTMKNNNDDFRYQLNGSSASFDIFANGSTSSRMSLMNDGVAFSEKWTFDAATGTFRFLDPVSFAGVATFDVNPSLPVPLAIGDISSIAENTKNGYTYKSNFDFSERSADLSSATNWTGMSGYFEVDDVADHPTGALVASDFTVFTTSTNAKNYHALTGLSTGAIHNGSGFVDELWGVQSYANNYGGGADASYGGYIDATNYGTGNVRNTLGLQILTGSYDTGVNHYDAGLYFPTPSVNGSNLTSHYAIILEDQRGATSSESYVFKYPSTSVANLSPFVITATGTVGIGTFAPSSTLHVVGNSTFVGDSSLNGAYYQKNWRFGQDVSLLSTDYGYGVSSTGVAVDITLPANPTNGRTIVIKDSGCSAATDNIRVDGNGSDTVDQSASVYTMNANCAAKTFVFYDGNWMSI